MPVHFQMPSISWQHVLADTGATYTSNCACNYTSTSSSGSYSVTYDWPVIGGHAYIKAPLVTWKNATLWQTDNGALVDGTVVNGYIQSTLSAINDRFAYTQWSGTDSTMGSAWAVGSTGTSYTAVSNNNVWQATLPASVRRSRLRTLIRNRSRQPVRSNKKPVGLPEDIREQRARETLRRLVGEQKYRMFLSGGFISVKSPRSGKVYQIFPGHGITRVYDHGRLVDRLCVVLKGNFPPTDSLIVRYLMILNDEADFRSRAVLHGVKGLREREAEVIDWRPLPEIAADQQGLRRLVS